MSPRSEIKVSCRIRKSKHDRFWIKSPKSGQKRVPKIDTEDDKEDDKVDAKDDKKLKTNMNKVSRIIETFEENIKTEKDKTIKIDVDIKKCKAENALAKLMLSGGKSSPSPGKKKRRKRLISTRSHGKSSLLEDWLRKEKIQNQK